VRERTLPQSWALADFQDVFKVASDGGKRIPESEYLADGLLPVIDQGEKPIGGYTNDEVLAFDGDLPVILFGDHTRRVKIVHHPFAVGAQGIKILRPMTGFDSRFLYHQFSILDLPNKGYSRHFQYLRKAPFVAAPPEEQSRIVAEIETQFTRLDAATTALKRVQANLKRYRASVLKAACEGSLVPTEAELAPKEGRDYEPADKLLLHILRERRALWEADTLAKMQASGKRPKDNKWKQKYKEPSAPDTSSLPPLPEGWCWANLEQLTSLITSGSRGWGDSYAEVGPLFVRAQDIKTDSLKLDSVAHVELPPDSEGTRTRIYRNDLLVTITGANVTKAARVALDIEEAYVSQHVGLVRPVLPATAGSVFMDH
jgi:type I restriction enzyme, S subunit